MKILFLRLLELVKDPPVVLGIYTWKRDVDEVSRDIKTLSLPVFNLIEDLIVEAVRRAEIHIRDLEDEAPPRDILTDNNLYFEHASFLISEINRLKAIL